MNIPTLIVSLVLIGVVGLIIWKMIKDRKQGKTSCSHGCQNCAFHGQCHRINKQQKSA